MPRTHRTRFSSRKSGYTRRDRPVYIGKINNISTFQNVEGGSHQINTRICRSNVDIRSQTTTAGQATTRATRARKPMAQINIEDGTPGTSASIASANGTKNQTELALKEYAKSGQAPVRNVKIGVRQALEKLSAAETDARDGNMNQAISVLDQASLSFSSLETTQEFVFGLAKNLSQTHEAHFRAVVLYFCSACLVKFGNSGISHCVSRIGKIWKAQQNLSKNLGIPIMKILLEKAVGEDKAFSLNWIAFAYNDAGEFRWATNYANQGIDLMEEKFGKYVSPQHQVYCRLLLTRGEAHHHLAEYENAATDLKRADKTLYKAKDFGDQKRVVARKIKQCRNANNDAIRRNRLPR